MMAVLSRAGCNQGTCHANLNGKDCGRFALKGRNFCARHGGRTPLGPDNHSFTTGLESVNRKRFAGIGKQLLNRLDELRDDPQGTRLVTRMRSHCSFPFGSLFEKLVLGPGDGFMLRRQLLTISKNASKNSHE